MAHVDQTVDTPRFEVRVTADSHFGWIRTRLSVERTMMSWLRTAVSLIGFGFAIVQFFYRLQQTPAAATPYLPNAPVYLGLGLIFAGITSLLISIRQYLWTARYLRTGSFTPIAGMRDDAMHSPVIGVAIFLTCIGLFAFFAVLLRLT